MRYEDYILQWIINCLIGFNDNIGFASYISIKVMEWILSSQILDYIGGSSEHTSIRKQSNRASSAINKKKGNQFSKQYWEVT